MYTEVYKLLRALKIPASKNYLRLRMESHPDYPSLFAITDTLDELGIDSRTYKTDKERLRAVGGPFLLHLNIQEGLIRQYSNISIAEREFNDFDKQWDGIALFAKKETNSINELHRQQLKIEKLQRLYLCISSCLLCIPLVTLFMKEGPGQALLCFSNIMGLFSSLLIIQKELGIQNNLGNAICKFAGLTGCGSVIFSKRPRILKGFSWGDIGVVYFSSSTIYFIACTQISELQTSGLAFYFLVSLATICFCIYSVYYQWRIVRQWCPLCLIILLVLLSNILVGAIYNPGEAISLRFLFPFFFFFLAGLFSLVNWNILKYYFSRLYAAERLKTGYLRLKRNPFIMESLFHREEFNERNLPHPSEPLCYGNKNAPYKIVMACNPNCRPCANAFGLLDKLYDQNAGKISIAIRFALSPFDKNDKRVIAANKIIEAARRINPHPVIKAWYEKMDMKQFESLFPGETNNLNGFLQEQINWSRDLNINETPTVFLNGRRLPKEYNWMEFGEYLRLKVSS